MKMKKGGVRPGAGRPKGKKKQNISVTLSEEVLTALDQYAETRRLSRSWVTEEALREYLEGKL